MNYVSKEQGYFLPYSYEDTKIVLLVKDPYMLFAYWEVSKDRRQEFIIQFGKDSWDNSRPVIKLTNVSHSKSVFIEINDFSNNWYLKVDQPNCIYSAEIGRLFSHDFFVNIATSNSILAPADKVSTDNSVSVANYQTPNDMQKISVETDLEIYQQPIEFKHLGPSSEFIPGAGSESFIK